MQYISTRGETPATAFDGVLLSGLAPDGGLFVPEHWPQLSADEIAAYQGLPYPELALRILKPFVGGVIDDSALAGIIAGAGLMFAPAFAVFAAHLLLQARKLEPENGRECLRRFKANQVTGLLLTGAFLLGAL